MKNVVKRLLLLGLFVYMGYTFIQQQVVLSQLRLQEAEITSSIERAVQEKERYSS